MFHALDTAFPLIDIFAVLHESTVITIRILIELLSDFLHDFCVPVLRGEYTQGGGVWG